MDLSDLQAILLAPDFDVEKHASQVLQSARDIGAYTQRLEEAEHELDRRLQEQVIKRTLWFFILKHFNLELVNQISAKYPFLMFALNTIMRPI